MGSQPAPEAQKGSEGRKSSLPRIKGQKRHKGRVIHNPTFVCGSPFGYSVLGNCNRLFHLIGFGFGCLFGFCLSPSASALA